MITTQHKDRRTGSESGTGTAAVRPEDVKLHQHTEAALRGLFDALGQAGISAACPIDYLYEAHWIEGITSDSATRINDWLHELGSHLLDGTLTATPEIRKLLNDWQHSLQARLDTLLLHHTETRSVVSTLSDINAIIPFLSAEPVRSENERCRMMDAMKNRKASVHESYRSASEVLKNKDLCDENRDALTEALLGTHRKPFANSLARNACVFPAHLEQAIPAPEDRDAFLAYAARQDMNSAWFPATKIIQKMCAPELLDTRQGWNRIKNIISASILQAKGNGEKPCDFDRTIAPLRIVCGRIKADQMAEILQTVLNGRRDANDDWLLPLFSYVSAKSVNDEEADFKARLHAALEELSGCDPEEETLATALFRFALDEYLPNAARMLHRKAGRDIDLEACLASLIDKTGRTRVEPECARIIIEGMAPADRKRALSTIMHHVDPGAIRETEKLLRKKDSELLQDRMSRYMIHPSFLPSRALDDYPAAMRKEISQDLARAKARLANLDGLMRVAEELTGAGD